VRPLIEAVLPLAEAAEAHRRLESGAVAGKLLLQAAEDPDFPPSPNM